MTTRESTTSPLLRRMNAAAVLEVMRRSGPVTGTELMAETGLSRPTVHTVCDELIDRGLVVELEGRAPAGGPGPGRRARQYAFNATAGLVLAIDLGAKKVTAQLADLGGEPVAEETLVFDDERVPARTRLDGVRAAVGQVLARAGADPSAVQATAMGVPSPVDEHGHVTAADHYLPGLAKLDLRAELRDFGPTARVENDANLAVLGERWRGVARGVDDVVELLAGYRLGSGLVMNGRLVRGAGGRAGELKFLSMVEGVGNTDAIAELAEVFASPDPEAPPESRVKAEAIFEGARAGDPSALRVVDRVLDRIARVVAIFGTLLNPELVVIGGGVAGAGDLIVPGLEARLPDLTEAPPRLAVSSLGDHAVVTGAVRVALDQAESSLFASPTP